MKILLWILIVFALVAVCAKKVKDFKAGKYCGCSCADCPKSCKKAQYDKED